jgi:HEAT repeat protein
VAGVDVDLEVLRAAALLDPDGQERGQVVSDFHRRVDRSAFEAALVLARVEDLRERMIGLDVLGQLGTPGRPFLEDTLPVVIEACDDWRPGVVQSAVVALGHLADPRGLDAALRQTAHHDEDVRQALAFTLPSVGGDVASLEVVAALVRLSADRSDYVRDWATFSLGMAWAGDSEQIRRALLDRVGDPDPDTAGEAFLGLARRRGDRRMLAALCAALEDADPVYILIEAAAELAAPELLPALRRLKQQEAPDDDAETWKLDEAIIACVSATRRRPELDPMR